MQSGFSNSRLYCYKLHSNNPQFFNGLLWKRLDCHVKEIKIKKYHMTYIVNNLGKLLIFLRNMQ